TTGQKVLLRFKPPESHGPAADQTALFTVAGTIPLRGVAADPALTPEFPGITDKDDAGDWDLPFDDPKWNRETVRQQYTTQYWDRYRAPPKAYITLDAGQKLWASRFGALTSIRLAPPESLPLDKAAKRFEGELLAQLSPEEGGFVFDEVKVESLKAS